MLGPMLRDLRAHIESLAVDDGEYTLVCSRHAEQPVPAAGLWFPTRQIARTAARATTQYRNALRQYDPTLPQHDIVVCQGYPSTVEPLAEQSHTATTTADATTSSTDDADDHPTADGCDRAPWRSATTDPSSGATTATRPLVQFCHHVAAAVFETLAAEGYDTAETAVMDAYLDHAEEQSTADGLCLRLLESMATVLSTRLSPRDQAAVMAAAADRLPPAADAPVTETDVTTVTAVFDRLQKRGVVGAYHDTPWLQHRSTGTRAVLIAVAGYAFSPYGGQLPTLPVVIELYRMATDWQPVAVDVATRPTGWRFRVVPVGEAAPRGLVSASVADDAPGCP